MKNTDKEKTIDEIIDFINHIYESINIYHTVIFYDENIASEDVLNELIQKLTYMDYPVDTFKNQDIDILELHSRIIIVEKKYFDFYFSSKNKDFSNITIILCLDTNVEKIIHEKLHNNDITFAEKMYIFSCIR